MESVHQKLGSQATVDELSDLNTDDMPPYDPYKDDSQHDETILKLDENPK